MHICILDEMTQWKTSKFAIKVWKGNQLIYKYEDWQMSWKQIVRKKVLFKKATIMIFFTMREKLLKSDIVHLQWRDFQVPHPPLQATFNMYSSEDLRRLPGTYTLARRNFFWRGHKKLTFLNNFFIRNLY